MKNGTWLNHVEAALVKVSVYLLELKMKLGDWRNCGWPTGVGPRESSCIDRLRAEIFVLQTHIKQNLIGTGQCGNYYRKDSCLNFRYK